MALKRLLPPLLIFAGLAAGQLTTDQKISDFQQLSGLFIKGYGPYEWKKQVVGFDLANTAPWLARIRATKSDLEFFDVMGAYVGGLDDAHSGYQITSNFSATLNFGVDIYDGKLLVDSITRGRLPVNEFPFVVGYELVSIDGVDATRILETRLGYAPLANPRSSRRYAAQFITFRPQGLFADAVRVPEISTVVFRRFDGKLETHRIPWTRSGVPWTGTGKLPTPTGDQPWMELDSTPDYMKPLERLWNCRVPDRQTVLNWGAVPPVWTRGLPANFLQRLGRPGSDNFFSGVYQAGGFRIGLIRIPTYAPANLNTALAQFVTEIAFMQDNTDGLIIDQTRNPGGSVAYMHALLSYVHHYPFRGMAFEVRATSNWVASFSNSLESAKAQGAPPQITVLIENILNELREANASNRGLTRPIPVDDITITRQPVRDARGNLQSYSKPLMVLIDEFSASGGDAFAAVIQDSGRGPLFGYRTMGAGGSITGWDAGSYSEGFVTMTESLMNRAADRAESGPYPVSKYVENVGVRPEIDYDYMTTDNLMQGGKPFVDAFTEAMVAHIRKNR